MRLTRAYITNPTGRSRRSRWVDHRSVWRWGLALDSLLRAALPQHSMHSQILQREILQPGCTPSTATMACFEGRIV